MMRTMVVLLAALFLLPAAAAASSISLVSSSLSAAPGGSITFQVSIVNDDPTHYFSIDGFNVVDGSDNPLVIDGSEGSGVVISSLPTVDPSTTIEDDSFLVTWLSSATPGYSISGFFDIPNSFCDDADGDNCIPNSDASLAFTASVSEPESGSVPEPSALLLLASGLSGLSLFRVRRS